MVLIPAAADQPRIPLIASGGIADARGLVAALALGADAVNMGSRFMCAQEAPIHERIKQHIMAADELTTDLIFRTHRNTTRVARNGISQQVIAIEGEGRPFEDVRELVAGVRGRTVYETGDSEAGIWAAGLCQGRVHDVPTCAELVERMMTEADAIIADRLGAMTGTAEAAC